jgi:hypothetical protein
MSRFAGIMCGILALGGPAAGFAQEQPASSNDEFWEVRQRLQAGAAAQLVLARDPVTAAILRLEGNRFVVWGLESDNVAPPLDSHWLAQVRDKTPMPDLRAKHQDEIRKQDLAAYLVFNQAVVQSFQTPTEAFVKSAKENAHVTFGHLWTDPARYRGRVIPIEGLLKRLRRIPATKPLQNEGISEVYEGWVYGPTRGSTPFCIIFTTLPEGVKPAEDLSLRVSFCGYFLKKMRYRAVDGDRETPLLIGPTIYLPKDDSAPSGPISRTAILAVVAVLATVVAAMLSISWWYKRGDQRINRKMLEMQSARTLALLDEAGTEPGEQNDTKPGSAPGLTFDPPDAKEGPTSARQ